MTSDGTNSYSWDAENRLLQITYPGSGNNTQFVYDGLGNRVEIQETTSGSVTDTKQFVLCDSQPCEERDGSSNLLAQYFDLGQVNFSGSTGTGEFYSLDHLNSTREMGHMSGSIYVLDSQFSYDPWGAATQIAGSGSTPDFTFASYYFHQRAAMNLTWHRVYAPELGRWTSRDPIGGVRPTPGPVEIPSNENSVLSRPTETMVGTNLYVYVMNSPLMQWDPSGLCGCETAPGLPSSSPGCSDYGNSTYLGASESCFCSCAGDSPWAQQVRGCLHCYHQQGSDESFAKQVEAHNNCYRAAGLSGVPVAALLTCEFKCKVHPHPPVMQIPVVRVPHFPAAF